MTQPQDPHARMQAADLSPDSDDKAPSRLKRLLAVLIMRAFARLPLRIAQALGGSLGWLAARLPIRERRTVEINLALCYPNRDPRWRKQLMQRHFVETGKGFAETCGIWHHDDDRYLDRIRFVEGRDLLERARASGDGLMLMVPHLGNWEIAANWCTRRFFVTGMFRPGNYPEVDQMMLKGREKFGGQAVPTDGSGVRAMLKALASGGTVFILPDHEPERSGGEFVPLFGVPALTGTLSPKLLQGRKPVRALFLYGRRLPQGQGWDLCFREPDPAIYSKDLATSLTALNRSLEALINECPEQYQWTYKRFKRRPSGEPKVYRR